MSNEDFESSYRDLVDKVSVMSLATVDPAGAAHAANVYFYADGLGDLLFVSSQDSDHSRYVEQRPEVAVTIYPEVSEAALITGIQLKGRCMIEPAESFEWLWESYVKKFPFAQEAREVALKQRFYRVHPYWARVIDNRKGFGFRIEKDWST